jgi:DNA-binding CsgD family transcriptional regulator
MRRVEILGADDPFEWLHPLVRRSIYDSLTVTERDSLHARAADVLAAAGASPGVVAAHYLALRPARSTDVVAGLLAAADEALARDAPEIAVTLIRRAVDEGAADPPRASLLLRLGEVELTRRNPAATGIFLEARELTTDPRERMRAAMGIAESSVFEGRWDTAAEITEQALAEVEGVDPELALEVELVRALVCALDPALAPRFHRDRARLLALARGESWPARALSAALAMISSFGMTPADEVLALCEHAMADGVLLAERGAGAFASGHVATGLVIIEEHERALGFSERVASAARAQGSFGNLFVATIWGRGWVAARRGDLATAEEILVPPIEFTRANGMLVLHLNALWCACDVILERPCQEPLSPMIEALELPPVMADAAGGVWLLWVRGRLRAQRGARAEAEADLRRAAQISAQLGFGPRFMPLLSELALALRAEDAEEARALVAEDLALAEASGQARERGVVLRASGLLRGGDEGIERLRESVAVLADSPARYEHARSLVELGASLRRAGHRASAREPLATGLELAHACGAERLVARGREELLAAGARPRRIVRSGFAALTASERRVVRLAAEGRSNPEIAQELYVSVKTVETHLSNAYRTLDLSGPGSRRALPELVAQADRASE